MTPRLETPRLVLDVLTQADARALRELAGHPEIAATTFRVPHPYTAEDAAQYIEEGAALYARGDGVVLAVRREGRLAGSVSLAVKRMHQRGELGFFIGRADWGQGYATEAVRAVLAFGFGHFALEKVAGHHFAGNVASGRVLEKAGLAREGYHPHHVKKGGGFLDLVSYGLTRPAAVAAGMLATEATGRAGQTEEAPAAYAAPLPNGALAPAGTDAVARALLARHFGGRTPEEIERELRVHGKSLAEHFGRLAPAALAYYLPAATAYLKSEYAEGDWDFAHGLAGALAAQLAAGRLEEETRAQARELVRGLAAQAGRYHLEADKEPFAGWVRQAENASVTGP
jgi:RimJ/RimL family protein N-acetyltransferase